MRFLNLILILLMWTEAVFAVSTTDNNKVVGKTLKVASEYVTSMSKVDGSFESGNTGWVASVGTIPQTASTEFQGNYKGLWSATGTGTLDLQWTATASNTYEASAIVSVDGADSDHYACAVVNGVETGCTLFDGPGYTPNKQIKVSVVADSVKGASFYLRIKHTGTDAFNLSIDDGKIQPWTAQTVQTVEQDAAGFSSGSTAVGNITFSSYGVKTGNLFTASGTRLTLNKDCYFVGQATGSGAAGTVYIRRYNQAGTLLESASSSYSTSGDRSAPFTKFVNAGDYFLIYTDFINTAIAFNATCSVNRNNVIQSWQAPADIGEIKYLPQNVAPSGFIPANGVTIGLSSGTYQGAAYLDLYKVLWNIATTASSDPYYISSAKGSSADADWAANKTIKIDESGFFTRAYQYGVTAEVGERQWDEIHDHTHGPVSPAMAYSMPTAGTGGSNIQTGVGTNLLYPSETGGVTYGAGAETRPMNVAKYVFIRYAVSTPTLLALPNGVETDYRISAAGNNTATITTSDNINFTVVSQTNGSWNGTEFTASVDGDYEVAGNVYFNSSITTGIGAFVNGSQLKPISSRVAANFHTFYGIVPMVSGQKLSFRSTIAGGKLVNDTINHHLMIRRLNGKVDKTFISNINPDGFNKTSGTTGLIENFAVSFGTDSYDVACSASPCSFISQNGNNVSNITRTTTGIYSLNFSKTFAKMICTFNGTNIAGNIVFPLVPLFCTNCNSLQVQTVNTSKTAQDSNGTILCQGY